MADHRQTIFGSCYTSGHDFHLENPGHDSGMILDIKSFILNISRRSFVRQGNMHNLANFLKATKISGIAHIDALYRFRGAVFCDFCFLAQKFLQKRAEFPKL